MTITITSKLALIVAVAAVGIASPAFAEFFNAQEGTGELPFSYGSIAPHHGKIAVRQSGLHAFASVPSPQGDPNPNDPALTGGGSVGYNQMLLQY